MLSHSQLEISNPEVRFTIPFTYIPFTLYTYIKDISFYKIQNISYIVAARLDSTRFFSITKKLRAYFMPLIKSPGKCKIFNSFIEKSLQPKNFLPFLPFYCLLTIRPESYPSLNKISDKRISTRVIIDVVKLKLTIIMKCNILSVQTLMGISLFPTT